MPIPRSYRDCAQQLRWRSENQKLAISAHMFGLSQDMDITMMTINVLFEHDHDGNPHGCSFIRLLRPLNHPSLADKIDVSATTDLTSQPTDVVIVERWWKPNTTIKMAHDLVDRIRRQGSTFIYTLDDNLLDIGRTETDPVIDDRLIRITRDFIREADGVIVSTPALANRLAALNENVYMIPNSLDEHLFGALTDERINSTPMPPEPKKSLTIGYMGTLTHDGDLKMIIEPIRTILQGRRSACRLELIGVTRNKRLVDAFSDLNIRILDPGQFVHYQSFIPWIKHHAQWDIGLAPLADTAFNRYKSDIKFIDYAALEIPAIYSAIGPYPASVQHGVTGLLVENETTKWCSALETLIDNADLRHTIARNAFHHVYHNRFLNRCANDWIEAIEETHSARTHRTT